MVRSRGGGTDVELALMPHSSHPRRLVESSAVRQGQVGDQAHLMTDVSGLSWRVLAWLNRAMARAVV